MQTFPDALNCRSAKVGQNQSTSSPAAFCPLVLLAAAAAVAGTELTEGDQLQVQLILQLSGQLTKF